MNAETVRVALLVALALGFLAGLLVRGQWRGRKVRLVRVPVIRLGRRPDPLPAPGSGPSRSRLRRRPPAPDRECAVYRFFDRDGALLYVGIAFDPAERAEQHAASKSWWSEVAEHETWRYSDRSLALAVEQAAIDYERPRYNTAPGTASDPHSQQRPPVSRVEFRLPRAPRMRRVS